MARVFVLLFFFLTLSTAVAETDQLVFAIDPTKPPMQFISENGEAVGFEIDFVNEMARLGGFTPVFKIVQWQSIFEGLKNDQYDAACASISITEVRKQEMAFTIPYYNVSQAILVSNRSAIQGVEDLRGKRVGAKKGTTSSEALNNLKEIELELFADVPGALKALQNKTIDAVICDGPVAGHYAFVDKTYDFRLAAVLKSETLELYGIAVKKGNKPLLNRLNQAITAAQIKNKDLELHKKWFSGLLGIDAQ